jgi:hypothetical protein
MCGLKCSISGGCGFADIVFSSESAVEGCPNEVCISWMTDGTRLSGRQMTNLCVLNREFLIRL